MQPTQVVLQREIEHILGLGRLHAAQALPAGRLGDGDLENHPALAELRRARQDGAALRQVARHHVPDRWERHALERGGVDEPEHKQAGCQRHEDRFEPARPHQRRAAADGPEDGAQKSGDQGPAHASRALGGKIDGSAEPEEAIGGADIAQVGTPGFKNGRVLGKDAQPEVGKQRRGDADELCHPECQPGADPCDLQGALALSGADIGAHHGDQGRAKAEHQRDQQIFQPRADAVAGDGRCAEAGDQGRGDADDDLRLQRDQRGN